MAQSPSFFGIMTVICVCIISASAQDCTTWGWFGDSCQYKCHCDPANSCGKDGSCSKCEKGWFGPACQFVDLVEPELMTPVLAKTKEGKCTSPEEWVHIKWNDVIFLSWLRLTFEEDIRDKNDIKIRLKETNNHDGTGKTIMECVNHLSALVDSKTVDIYCDMDLAISQVNISGPQLKSLCTVQISGGRNIALKTKTEQSSTWYPYKSELAVDGNVNPDFNAGTSCAHTNEHNSKPHWIVTLPSNYSVHQYKLYNRYDYSERLQGFTLEAFDAGKKTVFKYTDTQDHPQSIYYIRPASIKPKINMVKIIAQEILTLCEVEIFGDQECPVGFYGLQCKNKCKCHKKGEQCFFSTGVCPSGCARGYHKDGCQKSCDHGKWGISCLETCDYRCQGNACDNVDGRCLKGCMAGYLGQRCNIACDDGFYGINCKQVCPLNCNDEPCDKSSGDCYGCKNGYTGDRCD